MQVPSQMMRFDRPLTCWSLPLQFCRMWITVGKGEHAAFSRLFPTMFSEASPPRVVKTNVVW